jgi:transposase
LVKENQNMMGKKDKLEPKLFYNGISIERRIPQDHPLRKIKQLVDFTFIRSQVDDLYGKNGNESIDPVIILKMMLLLFYENIKSERHLASHLPLRLDWLWFCDYDIDDPTPNHSVISKARSRWGVDVFATFFENILSQCIEAGLVDGQTIHIDSSTIKADASRGKLKPKLELIGKQLYQQLDKETDDRSELSGDRSSTKITEVDPDARLAAKNGTVILGYKDHRVIDDSHGIITATVTTPANIRDEEHIENTGIKPDTAVADKGYGYTEIYSYLYHKNILPCIPHRDDDASKNNKTSRAEFIYDRCNDCYICPRGHTLRKAFIDRGQQKICYMANRKICEQCESFESCVSSTIYGRSITRKIEADILEWADNCLPRYQRQRLMRRRMYKAEGSFADAANNHGYKRARWRGLTKVKMQNLMIATIQNLRKLLRYIGGSGSAQAVQDAINVAILNFIHHNLCINRLADYQASE